MKKILSLILVALLALALTPAFAEGDGLFIGVVYKQSGNAYFDASVQGIQQAADELGFTFEHDGPDDGSVDGQIRIIQNYIAQGADAILVSAQDPAGLVDALQEAMEEGIVVISYDAAVNPEGRTGDVQPADTNAIGVTMLDSICNSIGFEGQIAVVSAMATATNQNAWIAAIEEALKDEKYAKVEYLGVVYGDDEYQKSFDETQALLEKYPDLKGLIVPTTVGGPAVSKCIQDAGASVKVTGLTLASDMKEFIDAGIADETFLWNPITLGYCASYVAVAVVNGAAYEVGAEFDCGTFGKISVNEDGTAYLNKLNSFTTETVNDWVSIL